MGGTLRRLIGGICFVALGAVLAPGTLHAEIVTIFSDSGFAQGTVFAGDGTGGAVFLGTATDVSPPEGFSSWKTITPGGDYSFWGLTSTAPINYSRFNNGEYRFWVYASTGNIDLQMKDGGDNIILDKNLTTDLGWNWSTMHDRWVLMRVPLTGIDLRFVLNPIIFVANAGPSTYYIDNAHFIDSTSAPNFSVTIATASQISWGNPHLPAQWVLADQYLSMEVDAATTTWGVQIYTDNTASDANPRYTGVISSTTQTPAGLVDVSSTNIKLDMAWAMRSNVSTITVVAADPNNSGDPNSFQWLYMEDHAQVANNQGAGAFVNGDPFITTRNNVGIHFAQAPSQFGPADPPYRIYVEANFNSAITPQTYTTSTLRVEFFTQ